MIKFADCVCRHLAAKQYWDAAKGQTRKSLRSGLKHGFVIVCMVPTPQYQQFLFQLARQKLVMRKLGRHFVTSTYIVWGRVLRKATFMVSVSNSIRGYRYRNQYLTSPCFCRCKSSISPVIEKVACRWGQPSAFRPPADLADDASPLEYPNDPFTEVRRLSIMFDYLCFDLHRQSNWSAA